MEILIAILGFAYFIVYCVVVLDIKDYYSSTIIAIVAFFFPLFTLYHLFFCYEGQYKKHFVGITLSFIALSIKVKTTESSELAAVKAREAASTESSKYSESK